MFFGLCFGAICVIKYYNLHRYTLIYRYTELPEAKIKDNIAFYNLQVKINTLENLTAQASQGTVTHFKRIVYFATVKVENVIKNTPRLAEQLKDLNLI